MEQIRHEGQDFVAAKVVQYEPSFDRVLARQLEVKIGTESYEQELASFEGFLNMQLLTTLGERFNRGESKFSYGIQNDKLIGEHSPEPVEDIFERGRMYREIHGNKIDHPREAAEVEGFKKMQSILADEQTPEGTVVISISPPGGENSIYKQNFYDIFQKKDGLIQASRFSSALTPEETVEHLRERWPLVEYPEEITDVNLLSNPIVLGKVPSVNDVHELIHQDHDVISESDFVKVQESVASLITSYIATLKEDSNNIEMAHLLLNAIFNKADLVADSLANPRTTYYQEQKVQIDDIYALGMMSVRMVDTGCGLSGGFGVGGVGAFGSYASVMDFGVPFRSDEKDQYGSLYFDCPSIMCKKINKRPYSQLIEKCQHCFSDVVCRDESETEKKKKSNN